jgi:hypothetical protein
MYKSVHFSSSWSPVLTRELITTLPSKSTSMCSVISILPIRRNVVYLYLIHLWAKVVLASFDSAAPIRAGAWEIMGVMPVGEADNTLTLV